MESSSSAPNLESLRREHALLHEQVRLLDERVYLSPREQLQRKRLQKMKLLAKDRIQALEASAPL